MNKTTRRSTILLCAAVAALAAVHLVMAEDTEGPIALGPQILDSMKVLPGRLTALPMTANNGEDAKVRLGRMLFFDKRLSRDGDMSCATCHDPQKGFADGRALALGFRGATLRRHTPTVLNAVYNKTQFWDGRAATLAEQAMGPIMASGEMNMVSEEELIRRLNAVGLYRDMFSSVYGSAPTLKFVGDAIASFETTLTTPDSRFDRYARGAKSALTDQEKRGLGLFVSKANCSQCHSGMNFTDDKFHNLGAMPGAETRQKDLGRFEITKSDEDTGAFKTPTLRNVAQTGPYMHDGSLATLEEVVDYYSNGGGTGRKSNLVMKLELTVQEKADLVAFLRSLSGTIPQPQSADVPRDGVAGDRKSTR